MTIFPEILDVVRGSGVTGRAVSTEVCRVSTWDPREFTRDRHRRVDDASYGGGPGMVMQYAPLKAALAACREGVGPEATAGDAVGERRE